LFNLWLFIIIIIIIIGIYIPANCPDVPKEFHGIGIRIEDDVLISNNGPVNLTAECPKHPSDIECVMKRNWLN